MLLVDDESAVRQLIRLILDSHGYKVLEACGAEEALETARLYPGPIHLLLTDVVMPKMGGSDLASLLNVVRPDTRVIYMSGYTDDAILRQGLLAETVQFLQKPFTPGALASKVREAFA